MEFTEPAGRLALRAANRSSCCWGVRRKFGLVDMVAKHRDVVKAGWEVGGDGLPAICEETSKREAIDGECRLPTTTARLAHKEDRKGDGMDAAGPSGKESEQDGDEEVQRSMRKWMQSGSGKKRG